MAGGKNNELDDHDTPGGRIRKSSLRFSNRNKEPACIQDGKTRRNLKELKQHVKRNHSRIKISFIIEAVVFILLSILVIYKIQQNTQV